MTKDDSVLSPGTRAGEAVRVDDPWAEARRMIDGWQGGINIAHEALDRHVEAGYGGQLAIRWLGKSGERRDLTYSDLQDAANRFAQVLGHHGLKPGDSVFAMAGRVPELYATALGTLKAGMIFTPLFSAFGPEPVRTRMEIGGANRLVTTESIYKPQDRVMGATRSTAEADPDHWRRPRPRAASRSVRDGREPHRGSRRWRRRRKTPR
jgi:acetyl-CoA synthetase